MEQILDSDGTLVPQDGRCVNGGGCSLQFGSRYGIVGVDFCVSPSGTRTDGRDRLGGNATRKRAAPAPGSDATKALQGGQAYWGGCRWRSCSRTPSLFS